MPKGKGTYGNKVGRPKMMKEEMMPMARVKAKAAKRKKK